MKPRSTTLVAATTAILAAVSGCSTSTETSPSQQNNKDDPSLSEVAPCETLTRNNQKSIATEGKGKSKEVLDARSCRWSISSGTVNVSLHSEKPIEELNFSKGTKKEYSINKKNGLLAIGNTEGICTVAIPFGDSQTATVDVESLKTATSCDLAKKIAPMVEQNISDS